MGNHPFDLPTITKLSVIMAPHMFLKCSSSAKFYKFTQMIYVLQAAGLQISICYFKCLKESVLFVIYTGTLDCETLTDFLFWTSETRMEKTTFNTKLDV